MHYQTRLLLFAMSAMTLGGCAGVKTFHEIARPGDTVAIAAGWKQHFTRDNITVTITPSTGTPVVLQPNDPSIAAAVNMYPDPLASLLVSKQVSINLTPRAIQTSNTITQYMTNGDNDLWETSIFINLPTFLPAGWTEILITNPQGEAAVSYVEIVDGPGRPNSFSTDMGDLTTEQRRTLERLPHYTISFSAAVTPYAIQIELQHDPDLDSGGTGRAYAVNPRGDLKNLSWSDTGITMRVLLTPARTLTLGNIKDFKFYVAGGITGLTITGIKAVDATGNTVAGVSASVN